MSGDQGENVFASRLGLSRTEVDKINRARRAALAARHVVEQRDEPSNPLAVAARSELRDLRARPHERS